MNRTYKTNFKEKIIGIYKENPNGDFGFIDVEGEEKGYYVFSFNKKDALDGDEVSAGVKVFKGREEAVVLNVNKRSENKFVGKFILSKNGNFGFVVIDNPSVKKDIFIAGKYIGNTKSGDIVSVKILKWEGKNPEGKIIDLVGKSTDKDIDLKSYISEAGFKKEFPSKIIKGLEKLDPRVKHEDDKMKKEYRKRKDLKKLFTFTVDSEDAKDLDDAISIVYNPPVSPLTKEGIKGGYYKLYVHIADVTHYIKEGSSLDLEAIKRGTSVYIPGDVLPMLPELLSNNLCSLNPNEDKLTLTCEMIIGKDGELKKQIVYESVIKSDYRLTYKEVDEILAMKLKLGDILTFKKELCENLIKTLKNADSLKKILSRNKQNKGVLNFDFPEIKINFDKESEKIEIGKYKKYNSNKLIEEFMVICNEAVSRKYNTYPFLYRIHETPKEDDLEKLQNILKLYNINFSFKAGTTKEFADLINLINTEVEGSKKLFLENTILRTLQKAIYSPKNEGHFGLGLKYYSHFTSPIRRYPDLQIHRIIKEKLSKKLTKTRIIHYKNILKEIADKSSDQERKAEKLEYKIKDYYIVKYYKNRIGERFEAVVMNSIPNGFFIQLENFIDGFIEKDNNLIINDENGFIKDKINSKDYRFGDKVLVELISYDLERLRLYFKLI